MTTAERITAVMALPSPDVLAAEATAATTMVVGITVSSDAELQLVTDDLRGIKAKRDALEARRLTITRPMDQAKAAVMDLFRAPLAAMDQAIEAGKRACLTYTRERDRRLAEEQRQREQAAAAERRRLEDEAAARLAQIITTPAQAREVAMDVQALQAAAATTVAPILPAPAKVAGAHTAKRWAAAVTDKRALARHLLEHEPALFDAWFSVEAAQLRRYATMLDGKVSLPGLEVSEAESMVLR